MKKITLIIICFSIITLPFIIADSDSKSNTELVRMTAQEVAQRDIEQDRVIDQVGQDFIIKQ